MRAWYCDTRGIGAARGGTAGGFLSGSGTCACGVRLCGLLLMELTDDESNSNCSSCIVAAEYGSAGTGDSGGLGCRLWLRYGAAADR